MKCFLLSIALLVAVTRPAVATFHLMQIQQVIGGVDGDTSAQAIQLRMRATGENFVSFARLVAFDTTGSNAVVFDLTTDVHSNTTGGSTILIATPNFAKYTFPTAVPDFIMATPIPTNYLAAGRLCWEDDSGTIYWSLSWGGAGYTGSTTGSTFNDADGNFGPSFSGPLPTTSTRALAFTGAFSALSANNAADYSVTAGGAIFSNNSKNNYIVVSLPPTVTSVARESNDMRITWTTTAGRTNFVQATTGSGGGNFSTNFVDASGPIVVAGAGQVTTNYLDVGGATNSPARYYRVRLVP